MDKRAAEKKSVVKRRIQQWGLLLAGAGMSALTIVSFVRTAGLFPGGAGMRAERGAGTGGQRDL